MKLLMMFKKNIDKIVIILITFLSFLFLGQWCYRSFYSPNKDGEIIEIKVDNFQYKAKNIPEIARKDFLLFVQQLDADEKKIFAKKKVDRKNIEKNIEILKDQGIWDGLLIESEAMRAEVDFEEYYNFIQDLQNNFQLKLDRRLKWVEKEKDLESFRAELKELRVKHRKDTNLLAEFAQKIQEEAEKPMPFFATWIGIAISVIICLIVCLLFSGIPGTEISNKIKGEIEKKTHLALDEVVAELKEFTIDEAKKYSKSLIVLFLAVYFPLQLLIFPLIDSLLLLSLREPYKYRFYNKIKLSLFFVFPVILTLIVTLFLFLSKIFIFCGCCIPNEEAINKIFNDKKKKDEESRVYPGRKTITYINYY